MTGLSGRGVPSDREECSKVVIGVVLVELVVVAMLLVASRIFAPKSNDLSSGTIYPRANAIVAEKEGSIDALFVGDSEFYSGFSPMRAWGRRGITSYVAATPCQALSYTFELVKKAFRTQAPRVVILNGNMIFASFSADKAFSDLINTLFPVFLYHNRWSCLTLEDLTAEPRATWTDDLKGYIIKNAVKPASTAGYMAPSDLEESLPPRNRAYLRQVIEYCRARGAEVLIVAVPSTVNWSMPCHNTMTRVAGELGVDFVDLNLNPPARRIGINWATDTEDAGDHLNYWGAVKLSDYLADYLKNSRNLEDHRAQGEYSSWNESYERYVQQLP